MPSVRFIGDVPSKEPGVGFRVQVAVQYRVANLDDLSSETLAKAEQQLWPRMQRALRKASRQYAVDEIAAAETAMQNALDDVMDDDKAHGFGLHVLSASVTANLDETARKRYAELANLIHANAIEQVRRSGLQENADFFTGLIRQGSWAVLAVAVSKGEISVEMLYQRMSQAEQQKLAMQIDLLKTLREDNSSDEAQDWRTSHDLLDVEMLNALQVHGDYVTISRKSILNRAESERRRKIEQRHPTYRYSDIAFPNQVVVGETEALRVVLTLKSLSASATRLELLSTPDKDHPVQILICVVVSPLDFDVERPATQTVDVPFGSDSVPVVFSLVAKSEGRKTIAIEFFQNACYLGRADLETIVVLDSRHLAGDASAHITLDLGANQSPPDLTILIDRVSGGDDRYYYRYRLLSYDRELDLLFREFRSEETVVTPQAFLEDTLKWMSQTNLRQEVDRVWFSERLSSMGSHLYGRLIPDDLKRLYWEVLRHSVKSILIISYEPWIPWELMRPFDPVTKQGEDGFLCERYDLTRWLAGGTAPDRIGLVPLGMVVAASNLAHASAEATEISLLLGSGVRYIPASTAAVSDLLRNGGYSGLHFICHGEYNRENPDWSKIWLLDRQSLSPFDVDGEKLGFGRDAPFVFLNACETGQGGHALTGLGGWADAFVRRAQCSGFVGTMWEVKDQSAFRFATAFYRNLLDGKPLGEAVRLARAIIKQEGDPSWLSYTVYANPLAHLFVHSPVRNNLGELAYSDAISAKSGDLCHRCGEHVRPGWRFCSQCGAPLEMEAQ